jgi:hypothetical protein
LLQANAKACKGNNIVDSSKSQDVKSKAIPIWNLSSYKLISLLDMLKLYADKFVELSNYFVKLSAVANFTDGVAIPKFTEDQILPQNLDAIRVICEEIGLKFSVNQINRIKKQVLTEITSLEDFTRLLDELESRLSEELSGFSVLVIAQKRADYYEQPNLFGENVFNKFPLANFDIEEAGKCFALARYTACVMHLQRVLERGLKSYGKFLAVTMATAQPSWQTVLDKTGREIRERNDKNITTKNWKSNNEKEFCEDVQPFLVAVKTAWRNRSMHADAKYTEDEAKEIFDAVKAFMRNLAKHLDGNGKFRKAKKK